MTVKAADLDGLMRAANRGDARAYRDLLHFLAPVLRGYTRQAFARFGRSDEGVEDVVQEALLAMHLKRHTWVEERPLLPWVRAIARNKLLDHLRRSARGQHLSIDEFSNILVADETVSADGLDADVAIGKLGGRQRDIVVGILLEGKSAREVAERVGMQEGAVRVTLHRALRSLAKAIRDDQP